MKEPKVSILHEQGSAKAAEDGIIHQPPCYYGVTDGLTGVYLPDEGPKKFGFKTGGQLASSVVVRTFATIDCHGLAESLFLANTRLGYIVNNNDVSLKDSAFLPGAQFAVCKIGDEEVEIIKGGDCVVVWKLKDGSVGALPNQNYNYEKFLLETISQLMKKHGADRQKMWEEFRPILIEERRRAMNTDEGKICVLNGQPDFIKYWQQVSMKRDDLQTLILATDGLMPFELTQSPEYVAQYIFDNYWNTGLHSVLALTRSLAAVKSKDSHEDFPEATAVTLEF